MECEACHTANPASNRYCEHCGESFALKCPACGFGCGPAAKFCGACGKALPSGDTQELVASPPIAASPPTVAAPLSRWGELKQATVLFADIVSSTEQIAQLDPEEAMDRLQPAVTLMCETVERFGGTVIRTLGDGVMALFGVPKALEGHTRLACEAALQMQQAMACHSSGLRIRVGMHCGLVASDPHAHDIGKGGSAHGLTIHLASRVVGVAPPGGVTITQDCHALVRGLVEVESLGHPPLKGIAEPVEIFRLLAFRPAFGSRHFKQSKLTPFLGRDREMALLQQAQRLTEVGDARVIGVSGGPGSGKSRLCYEFSQWCRARGKLVFEVRAQLFGNATPLQPVLALMRRSLFGISMSDSLAVAREKIAARLAELDSAQPSDQALLSEFLGVAQEHADRSAAASSKLRRTRLLAVVSALIKHSAGAVSIVLIEDMHWLDEASEEFVASFVDAVAATRTMVLLNYRSSYRSPWAGRENFREIELAELSASDTEVMVRELISHPREFQDVSQLIARRSGGNPFFAEELVRSLAERGVLSGEPDMASGIDSVERALPATVQAVIGARIDHLHDDEKSVLQMCAIIGKEVPLGILERVTGSPLTQLERVLDALCRVELIQPQPAAGEGHFSFRHPLIQEVAYGTQMKAKRAAIHLAVAKVMETYYAGQIDEYAALIAHHYECAGHWLEAAEYCSRSARWLSTSESARAINNWRKVRALLLGRPESAHANRLRATACSQIALLGWREGMSPADVQPFIEEAMDLAREVDSRLMELLLMLEGRMVQARGGPSDWYVAKLREALALTSKNGHVGSAVVWAALSQAYGWAGLLKEALDASDAALAGVATIDSADREFIDFEPEQWIMGMRGRLLTRLGRYHEARECWRRMLAVDPATPIDPTIRTILHLGHVEHAWCTNDAALAAEHARQVELLADSHSVPNLKTVATYCLGIARALAGDLAAGIDNFSQVVDLVRGGDVGMEHETEILASLSECHRRNGDTALARSIAVDAIEMSRQRSTRLPECRALITLGAALIDEAGGTAQSDAEQAFAQAESLIKETGAVIYEAELLAQRSRLCPDPSLAQTHSASL